MDALEIHFWDEVTNLLADHYCGRVCGFADATREEDLYAATDFWIGKKSVAMRIREERNCKYRDMTIRTYNKGHNTEIDKITKVDLYFYGWAYRQAPTWLDMGIDTSRKMVDWILIDIPKMIQHYPFDKWKPQSNRNPNTAFIYKAIKDMPKAIICGKIGEKTWSLKS